MHGGWFSRVQSAKCEGFTANVSPVVIWGHKTLKSGDCDFWFYVNVHEVTVDFLFCIIPEENLS